MGEYCWPSSGARRLPVEHYFGIRKMKVTLFFLAALAITVNGKPAPNAEPKAFFGTGLGAIALPAITNSALIDGLLLGKVAFLKAAILANLLLGSSDESADDAEYGAPAVDSYGAPAQEYAEPAPSCRPPAQLRGHQLLQVLGDALCGSPRLRSRLGPAVSRLSAIVPGLITLFGLKPQDGVWVK